MPIRKRFKSETIAQGLGIPSTIPKSILFQPRIYTKAKEDKTSAIYLLIELERFCKIKPLIAVSSPMATIAKTIT